jgi:hypothetical protein
LLTVTVKKWLKQGKSEFASQNTLENIEMGKEGKAIPVTGRVGP